MSTFAQICQSVLEESDGRVETFTSVNLGADGSGDLYITEPHKRNIVRWVKQALKSIQHESSYWDFMHKRGTFLTAVADKEEYVKRFVREIKENSVYAVQSGSTGRVPLIVWDYDYWVERERAGATATGGLRWLLRAPSEKWILYPVPTTSWTVYADWWLHNYEMDSTDDEPPWDEEYHDILMWEAIKMWAAEYEGEGSAPRLLARVDQKLPQLMSAFRRRYLPRLQGAPPLT